MEKSQLIEKVKEFIVKLTSQPVAEPVKLGEAMTSDGKKIMFEGDVISEGANLLMVDESGNQVPVPNGDYTMEDGTVVSVMDSKVSKITVKEEEIPSEEQAPAQAPVEDQKMTQLESQVNQLQKQVEDLTKLNAEFMEQQKVVMSSVQSLLETPVVMSKQEPNRELRSFEKHIAEQKKRNELLKGL